MKTFSKTEIGRIKSLAKGGKTQYQIAKALHTRKQNVASFLAKRELGARSAFGEDVRKLRELGGDTYEDAVQKTKMLSKWLGKRVGKLTSAEQKMHQFWSGKTKEFRRSKFKTGAYDLSDKLMEDYESYFETPQ